VGCSFSLHQQARSSISAPVPQVLVRDALDDAATFPPQDPPSISTAPHSSLVQLGKGCLHFLCFHRGAKLSVLFLSEFSQPLYNPHALSSTHSDWIFFENGTGLPKPFFFPLFPPPRVFFVVQDNPHRLFFFPILSVF